MVARFRAFAIHLAISALVAAAVLILVFQVWYPGPLSEAVGVTHIFLLLILVDLTLGPTLTLVVYKKGKKSLKLDLAIIALLQLGALAYGLYNVAEGRPAWLVFSADRFDVVRVIDIDTRYADKVSPEYRSPPLSGPRWVAAVQPEDLDARSTITLEAVFAGFDLQHRPYLYQPLSVAADAIRTRALPLEQLGQFNSLEQVKDTLARWPEANAWLPLWANAESKVVLINKESAEVVAIVDLSPWA